MSFDFNKINSLNKAQAAYNDGGGMGGGGMYMRQGKKRKEEEEEDIFERREEKDSSEIEFSEISDEDIPQDTLVNQFVNWFRIKKS